MKEKAAGQAHADNSGKADRETEPPPILGEVEKSINKIRKNKSPGQDEIPIDLHKAARNSATIVYRLYVLSMEDRKMA